MHEQAARARFLFAKHFSSREHSNRLALITRSPEKAGHLEREREEKKHIFNLHFSFRSWALYFSEQVFCAARFLRRGLRDIQTCLLLKSLVFWPRHFSCKAPHTIIHTHTQFHVNWQSRIIFRSCPSPFPSGDDDLRVIDTSPLRTLYHFNMTEKSPAWTSGSHRKKEKETCVTSSTVSKGKQLFFFLIFFTTALTNIRVPVRASPK